MANFVPVVYSTGGPVRASNGSQRVACVHMAAWLRVYDALQVARGRGHVTYLQTVGGADASAGTHLCGSAWDMVYIGDAAIMDAREMGASQWHRIPGYNGWPSSGANHCHGVIRCGDNACNGYQYTAWLSGHNGLGLNGVGAGDSLPKPSVIRTWQQGIAWAQAEIARLSGPMTITTQEDEHMSTFMQVKGDPTVYLTDGITARKIPDEKTLRDLYYLGALYGIKTLPQGTPDTILVATDVVVRVVGNPAVIGKVL